MPRVCHFAALLLLAIGSTASARAVTSSAPVTFQSPHALIVVTIPNEPFRLPARAGTTGSRYAGDNYGVAQSAHQVARRLASAYSLREVASWPIRELGVHCVVFEIPDDRPVAALLAALGKDSRVVLAEPMNEFHTLTAQSAYNDPLFGLQSNLVSLGIPAAHARSQGSGVRVALIDTGVDGAHPDLRGRIARTHSFIGARSAGASAERHGTAMAGLIAAVANNNVGIVGIAPLAQVEVFEACWQLAPDSDEAACNTFTLAQALAAALESRAPLINLSIAGPADPLLSALVQSGLKRGVIFVGSAADVPESFPTNIEGVIAVGGSDRQYAGAVLSAPSVHVLTLRPAAQYDFESGTSVAAAEMTGICALLLASNARLTAGEIVTLLKNSRAPADASAHETSLDVSSALARLEAQRSATAHLASRAR